MNPNDVDRDMRVLLSRESGVLCCVCFKPTTSDDGFRVELEIGRGYYEKKTRRREFACSPKCAGRAAKQAARQLLADVARKKAEDEQRLAEYRALEKHGKDL